MSTTVNQSEGRRIQRISLPLPTRVDVRIDDNVSWHEVTRLNDVSAFGAGFSLKRPVKRGRIIHLSIPMPRQLRCYDFGENQYKIWALVRRCIPISGVPEEQYMIGVAFIGKNPPQGFLSEPSRLFDTTLREETGLWRVTEADPSPDESELPRELRRQTRFFIPEPVLLEVMDDDGNVTASESTVTENISFSGAAVFTALDADTGSFLRVTSKNHGVSIISIVRRRRVGPDGLTRLHLEFVDRFFPLEGVE